MSRGHIYEHKGQQQQQEQNRRTMNSKRVDGMGEILEGKIGVGAFVIFSPCLGMRFWGLGVGPD